MTTYVAIVDGKELKEGDKVKDFRGDEVTFLSVTRQGARVYVNDGRMKREFFPSVIRASIEKR